MVNLKKTYAPVTVKVSKTS